MNTPKKKRSNVLKGKTYREKTGCGTLYVTINEEENKPFEIFLTMGKSGGCAASQIEAIGRVISLALRNGVEAKEIFKQIQGISCHSAVNIGENKILSCSGAIAQAIKSHIEDKEKININTFEK